MSRKPDENDENLFLAKRFDHEKVTNKTQAATRAASTRINRQPLRTDQCSLDDHGFLDPFQLDYQEQRRPVHTPAAAMIHIRRTNNPPVVPSPDLSQRRASSSVLSRRIDRIDNAPSETATMIDSDDENDSTDVPDGNDEPLPGVLVAPAPTDGSMSFSQAVLTPASILQWQKILEMIQEDLEQFVYLPVPMEIGDLQCRITRDKKGMEKGFFPTYYMHVERPGDGKKLFILAARKRRRSATTNYLISTDATDLSRGGEKFCGKVRGDMMGTHFTVFDQGERPKKKIPLERQRRELAAITYETNILGFKGPRKMSVIVPGMTDDQRMIDVRPNRDSESLAERAKHRDMDQLLSLQNKAPVWNDETQSYVLNFHGRVTEPSVKNFQLVYEDDLNPYKHTVCLQFGRIDSDVFTCDFKYPLCAVQAFGIALSSLDSKLACE